MKNEYLAKILKIAGQRDYELEDDRAFMDDQDTGEQAVLSSGFWDMVKESGRLSRRATILPDDIRDMFDQIPESKEINERTGNPLTYEKAAKIIIKNIPQDLMSFEKEIAFDNIRNGLRNIIENKIQPMPEQAPVNAPTVPAGEEIAEDIMANSISSFKKIAEARARRKSSE